MTVILDESIRVGAVFAGRTLQPVWFSRDGRQVRIREIAYTWKTHEGRAAVLHFSVTDGQALYEICYNLETMAWRLEQAEES